MARKAPGALLAAENLQPVGVIAQVLELDARRVQQLAREGVIPKASRGRYDLVGSVQGYVRFLRDRAQGREGTDADAERSRFQRARADLAELELAERRGELVRADDEEANRVAVASAIRTRALAVPSKAAPLAYAAESVQEAEAVIRTEIHEALQELADTKVETTKSAADPR